VGLQVEQRVSNRLAELVDLGEQVLRTRQRPPPNVLADDYIDVQLALQWFTSV